MEIYRKKNTATEIPIPILNIASPEEFLSGLTLTITIYARDIGDSAGWQDITPSNVIVNPIAASGGYGIELSVTDMAYDLYFIVIEDSASAPTGAKTCIIVNTLAPEEVLAHATWEHDITEHTTKDSAGRRLRNITSVVITEGVCPSGPLQSNQIVLNGDASTVDGAYDPAVISIVNGIGLGQSRLILQYEGSTKTATVDRDWKVEPDDTSEYILTADPGREHVNEGLARAGTNLTMTLNVLASDDNDAYNGQIIFIRSGTGADQARKVTDDETDL